MSCGWLSSAPSIGSEFGISQRRSATLITIQASKVAHWKYAIPQDTQDDNSTDEVLLFH